MNGQYQLSSQFFHDMAWGGLTTYKDKYGNNQEYDFFENMETDASDRERIKDTISIELTGKDENGYSKDQRGKNGGC